MNHLLPVLCCPAHGNTKLTRRALTAGVLECVYAALKAHHGDDAVATQATDLMRRLQSSA